MAARKASPKSPDSRAKRRSPCPVACTLDIVGDRWSLLIVRDMLLGRDRFKDFTGSPEGIPTNILSERLLRLSGHGIIEAVPSRPGSSRMNYGLTEKGRALVPLLRQLRDWGLRWEKDTRAAMTNAEAKSGKPKMRGYLKRQSQ